MANSQSAIMRPLGGLARAFAALQNRLYQPPPDRIEGVKDTNWPTALQPVEPVGPPGSQPLLWSYWVGLNQNISPRPDADLSFGDLRGLATYPLARICIENIKDQLSSLKWTFQLKEVAGESLKDRRVRQEKDKNIPMLAEFFAFPDGETPWSDWVRPLIEDLLVIDAACILVQRTLSGKVVKLRVPDGADILRLIDDQGYTPAPPSPAYTQLWEGIPRILLTTDQLVYRPRNIVRRGTVASQLYGCSPTESLKTELQCGIERLRFVLAYYVDGSVPGIVQMVPPGVNPDVILEGMQWMNSELAGQLAKRRQWRNVQSFSGNIAEGPKDKIEQLKEPILADVYDDLHIRKVAFAYGASAQRLLRMMNRACYSEDTETLTESGWKLYDQIGRGEKIAQFIPENGSIEFVEPTSIHVYPYSGEMVHFKTHNVDILVTPEHKMWLCTQSCHRTPEKRIHQWEMPKKIRAGEVKAPVKAKASITFWGGEEVAKFTVPDVRRGNAVLTKEEIAEIKATVGVTQERLGERYGVSGSTICRTQQLDAAEGCIRAGATVNMDDWLEFLGYFLSEGGLSHRKYHYLLTLSQKSDKHAAKIESCLSRLPFSWKRYPEQKDGMVRWNVYGKNLADFLMKSTGGYCWNKRIPREFMRLGFRQLGILFDALMDGDGSWDPRPDRTGGSYSSTSRQLADDVQELAAKLGYCASVRSHQDPRPTIKRPRHRSYTVTICERGEHTISRRSEITREKYEGIVYCFTVPSGLFITRRNGKIAIQGNSAMAGQEAAQEEGTIPWVQWLKETLNVIIQRKMGMPAYEAIPDTAVELDPTKQMEIDTGYVKNGIFTINERRDLRGAEPRPEPEANGLMVVTATGVVPIAGAIERTEEQHQAAIAPKPAPIIQQPGGGGNNPKPKPAAQPEAGGKKKLVKAASIKSEPHTPQLALAKTKLYSHVAHFLYEAGKQAAAVKVEKRRFRKATQPTPDDIDLLVTAALSTVDWTKFVGIAEPELEDAAIEGARVGLEELGVLPAAGTIPTTEVQALISEVNTVARDWAKDRAAEMVGMKWVDGELVENPDAKWRIDTTTRNMLRRDIAEAFSKETPIADLTATIRNSGAFSESRADLIATTEVSNAQMRGNAESWLKNGNVQEFKWQLSADHVCCDICDIFAMNSPHPVEKVLELLAEKHPRCQCAIVATKIKGVEL